MAARGPGAGSQDRAGGALLMASLFGLDPFRLKLDAGGGYQGPALRRALQQTLGRVKVAIVKRCDQAKAFVGVPQRWIVERTVAWPGRCRRLAKDFDNLNRKARACLRLASLRLMLRKLCHPA